VIETFEAIDEPVNESEKRFAIALRAMLEPGPEKFAVFTNVRLPNGRSDFSEFDAIVVAEAVVYCLEVKGYGGRIIAQRDRWYLEDGASFENPSNRIAMKAKTLGSQLMTKDRSLRGRLWVQDLVFVNGRGAKLADVDYARRSTFEVIGTSFDSEPGLKSALREPRRWCRAEPLTTSDRDLIVAYVRGGEKRSTQDRIGKYLVVEELAASSDRYRRLLVRDRYDADVEARAELHAYPIDGRTATTAELARSFNRQIKTVEALGKAGACARYLSDDEGPWRGQNVRYVVYEWLGRLKTLGDSLARTGAPGLREGLRLAIGLGDAIAAMHEQGFVHGALDPSVVYVRDERAGDEIPRMAIGRIELARPRDGGMSVISSLTASETVGAYASPDVLANKYPDIDDDLFSFGAIVAHVLRGRPIFASASDVLARFKIPKLLEDRSEDPPELIELVRSLLSRSAFSRPRSMRDVTERLRDLYDSLVAAVSDPTKLGDYTIEKELRAGATGRTVIATRRDLAGQVVLKIAAMGSEALRREVETLRSLPTNEHIVVAYDVKTLERERVDVAEFALVPGSDGEHVRGNVPGAWLPRIATGLFSALAVVHARGIVHRDVKPANVMIGPDGEPTLLDFGLACAPGDRDLVVGTAPYKSERLFERKAWATADDVFAAAVTLWELATARHPWQGEAPHGPPAIDAADLGTLVEPAVAKAFAVSIEDFLTGDSADALTAQTAVERLRSVFAPRPNDLALPLTMTVELPEAAREDDALLTVSLSLTARRALEDLEAGTLDDVRLLDNADFTRVSIFGRGVTEELRALRIAVVMRFGEISTAKTSIMRSVQPSFAPMLSADAAAVTDSIDVLALAPALGSSLRRHGLHTVGAVGAASPAMLERDSTIGAIEIAAIRASLAEYVSDPERLVVEAAMPPWRVTTRSAYIEAIEKLGGARDGAIDLLEVAGGFEIERGDGALLGTSLVAAPPWREDELRAALVAMRAAVSWPPIEASVLAEKLTVPQGFAPETIAFFAERVSPTLDGLARTGDERFYARDACSLADAFAFGIETVVLPQTYDVFAAAVERRLPGMPVPAPGTDAVARAFASAGLAMRPDGRVDRIDAIATSEAVAPADLAGANRVTLSTAATALLAAAPRGGYRLVVAEPAVYHARVRALVAELHGHLGARLRVVDLDATLCERLERDGTLAMAVRVQSRRGLAFDAMAAIAGPATREILDGLLEDDRERVTIATNLGSLGLTGVAGHLGAIYDAARGGRHGLVIVCVPGDHPTEHARLNRELPLPIQPTERPIALDDAA